ncbi:MAG: DNA sulfur modification protein DndB [Alphaproteobacteria bacterium]
MTKRHYIPALRGRFGDWAYYSTLMTMQQVATRISYAQEIHSSQSLSELIQRELKEGRAKEIAEYIGKNDDRFFNSLVVAIYGGSPGWHELEVTAGEDVESDELDDTALYSIGYLSLTSEEKIFALDGQHRLAGIQQALKKDSALGDEELPVIFVAHHNNAEGLRRTRKLFTTLNKQARPVKKSEIIALDESDMMAIASRHLVETHKYFNRGQIDVMRKQANLAPNNTQHLTTIINLYDVLNVILPYVKERLDREKAYQLKVYRPADDKVEEYCAFAGKFFEDLAKTFPPLKRYFEAKNREAVLEEMRTDGGHILFRPLGLLIFSRILRELRKTMTYQEALKALAKLPVSMDAAPYADTIWNTHRKTIEIRREAVCREVLLYMLGRVKKGEELRRKYARALEQPEDKVNLPDKIAL